MDAQTKLPMTDENDRIATDSDMEIALSRIILSPNSNPLHVIGAIKTKKEFFDGEGKKQGGEKVIGIEVVSGGAR